MEEVQPEVVVEDASRVMPIDRTVPESESVIANKELVESSFSSISVTILIVEDTAAMSSWKEVVAPLLSGSGCLKRARFRLSRRGGHTIPEETDRRRRES